MKLRIVVVIDYEHLTGTKHEGQRSNIEDRRKNLQPEWLEQSHADYVLPFVADGDVVEEHSFQFETKSAVEIDVAHVDVTRMNVNLVQVPDHKGIVKKAKCCSLSDSFAL